MNTNMNKNTYDQKTSFEIDLSDSEMFRSTTLFKENSGVINRCKKYMLGNLFCLSLRNIFSLVSRRILIKIDAQI